MKTLLTPAKPRRTRPVYQWTPGHTGESLISQEDADQFTDGLVAIAAKIKGLPADFARNHDAYIHGLPKK